MSDDDKVDVALESSLTFTYKVRGIDDLKVADSVSELLKGRDVRGIAGKKISIFCNGKRVGDISCDALLWSIMRKKQLVFENSS